MIEPRKLTHARNCDPRERTTTSCPCGTLDGYTYAQEGQAEAYADRYEQERGR